MKVALLQLNMTVGDINGNARKIVEAVNLAKAKGVDLCISSEMALTGYPPRDLLLNSSFINQCLKKAEEIALNLKDSPVLLLGLARPTGKKSGKPLYNSVALIRNGKIEKFFDKSLLPTYDVFDEGRYFEPASEPETFSLNGKNFGITVCEDVWNDIDFWAAQRYRNDPLKKLADKNVDFMINVSASPFAVGKQKLRETMLSAIAKKYGKTILYVNQCGGNDDLVFDGRSCIFDGQGNLFSRGKMFEEDVVFANLKNKTSKIIEDDKSQEAEAWMALVTATRDYVRKCGFEKVLLGLSGGIDSALTAAIAQEALGADKVLAVLMPSPYSSKGSVDDSLKLAERLEIKTLKLPIENIMNAFDETLHDAFKGLKSGLAEENIQARIRGNLLMALSNKYGALLLTTGNKSELAVGYCTIYGDMSGGFAVISDVPKTLVYKIARWLNKQNKKAIIPVEIIEKAPSAELRLDQKDQDTLPDYELLDKILKMYIEEHKSMEEIKIQGIDSDILNKVKHMVKVAEFKRKQAAPGVKITDQAFGSGWRMPIACKIDF